MDNRGDQRPPRSARPLSHSRSPAPPYPDQSPTALSPFPHSESSKAGVSFKNVEQGDRQGALDSYKHPRMPSAYAPQLSATDPEHSDQFDPSRVGRKKSLVRPDREKIDPGHRQWHYRSHVAQLEEEGHSRVGVMPSSKSSSSSIHLMLIHFLFSFSATGNYPLRRGQSLLAREEDIHESGLALFKRGHTMRRKRQPSATPAPAPPEPKKKRGCWNGPGPSGPWMIYCLIITMLIPSFLLKSCGV